MNGQSQLGRWAGRRSGSDFRRTYDFVGVVYDLNNEQYQGMAAKPRCETRRTMGRIWQRACRIVEPEAWRCECGDHGNSMLSLSRKISHFVKSSRGIECANIPLFSESF
jgi:hypothetical protein